MECSTSAPASLFAVIASEAKQPRPTAERVEAQPGLLRRLRLLAMTPELGGE